MRRLPAQAGNEALKQAGHTGSSPSHVDGLRRDRATLALIQVDPSASCPLSSHTTSSHPASHLASFYAVRAVCQWTALTDMVMAAAAAANAAAAAAAAKMTGAVGLSCSTATTLVPPWQCADGASHLLLLPLLLLDPARPPPPRVVAVVHCCTEPQWPSPRPHRRLPPVVCRCCSLYPSTPAVSPSSSSSAPPPRPRLPHVLLLTVCRPPPLETSCPHVSSHRRARHRSLLLLCISFPFPPPPPPPPPAAPVRLQARLSTGKRPACPSSTHPTAPRAAAGVRMRRPQSSRGRTGGGSPGR